MSGTLKALVLGDLVGQSGYRAVYINLKQLIKKHSADFVVVNGENAAEGYGITSEIAGNLKSVGVDVITTGNHVWQLPETRTFLDTTDYVLRPANYPKGVAGHGVCIIRKKDLSIAVCNLQGRERMGNSDCPFQCAKTLVKTLRKETPIILCDFHAEETAEKEAFGMHFDGKFSLVVGTHTHVQTADERILPRGSGYISDLGMCGATDSVIGFQSEIAVNRVKTQLPLKMEIDNGPATIHGVLAEIDTLSGKTSKIERIKEDFAY